MALFKDLTRAVAEAEGISDMTVTGIGQYLRDAGLISKLGRGKAAAQMTLSDAANLVIAVNATDMAKNAAETVVTYRNLFVAPSPINQRGDPISNFITQDEIDLGSSIEFLIAKLVPGPDGQNDFEDNLRATFSTIEIGMGRPVPSAYIKICFDGPRSPSNPFSGTDRSEKLAFSHYWNATNLWSEHYGQRELRVFTKRTLSRVAEILA